LALQEAALKHFLQFVTSIALDVLVGLHALSVDLEARIAKHPREQLVVIVIFDLAVLSQGAAVIACVRGISNWSANVYYQRAKGGTLDPGD
jgi:hypothetical protein